MIYKNSLINKPYDNHVNLQKHDRESSLNLGINYSSFLI